MRSPDSQMSAALSVLRLEPQQTARDRVADLLRTAILQGQMRPGQRLPEMDVAQQLNVSRMPVREAFGILESEGLLSRTPNRGVVVADVSLEDVEEVYWLRALLEGLAAEQAAPRLQDAQLARLGELCTELRGRAETGDFSGVRAIYREIHSVIWSGAGRTLGSFCHMLYGRFPKDLVQIRPERGIETVDEYQVMLEALRRRDGVAAREAIRHHIDGGRRLVVEHFVRLASQRPT